jgi:type IV secretory pathway VirB10-like protein
MRQQLSKSQTAPAPKAAPPAPTKIKVPPPDSLVLYAYTPPQNTSDGTGLTAGTVVNVSLKTRVNSERQTVVVAEVREHIRDSRNPTQILMPQFSKVILEADPQRLVAGEERVEMQLARIELPNRQTIELPKEPVVDQIGQGGLTGAIDRKWRYVLPALLLRGVFAASVQSVTTLGVPALHALQADGRQIGQTVTEPYVNSRPVIRIQEGERAAVILTTDLSLPVYHF